MKVIALVCKNLEWGDWEQQLFFIINLNYAIFSTIKMQLKIWNFKERNKDHPTSIQAEKIP